MREQPGQALTQTLAGYLADKCLLLVLDNCEHLVAACASLVGALLRACPQVSILATSREALNIAGEQVFPVPPLPLPPERGTSETITQNESVRLFVERAQAQGGVFALSAGNAASVAQVCRRLDGIPLAIELAAARVRALPVEQIARRLDDRFRLLTGGARTALPRQQTLRALIDWSYDLLTEPERALLGRLSVFAGGWTLDAAEAVCAGDGINEWDVLDLLSRLVDKSLVMYDEPEEGVGRYRLLETLRQYGQEKLAHIGQAAALHERHQAWCLTLAEEAEPQLTGPEQAQWLSRLETEHDNLRAALTWHEKTPEAAENGLRLAGALWRFWIIRGYFSEGRQWLGRALASAKPEAEGRTTSVFRAKAFNGAGNLADAQGDYGAARALYTESLEISRLLGNQQGIAASLYNLGIVADSQGDYGSARALHTESLKIRRLLGNQQDIAASLNNLGILASAQDDYGVARALHAESLEISRLLGNQRGIAVSLYNLGIVANAQGDYGAARALHAESLEIKRRLGDQWGIAYSLEGLAGVAHGQNQLSRAASLWGAASSLREAIGSSLSSVYQKEIDERAAAARAALGDEAFSAAWDAGRAITLDEACGVALAEG